MLSSLCLCSSPSRAWAAANIATFVAIAGMVLIGFVISWEIRALDAPVDDASWVVSEIGFEHQRLLLAAETGESLENLRLRGDIYLSRIMILRDSPLLAEVRQRMVSGGLTRLYKSAQATDQLTGELDLPEGRQALLQQLRSDAQPVRDAMIDVATLNHKIEVEKRTRNTQHLLGYLAGMEVLALALLGFRLLIMNMTRRLRSAGRELNLQLATRDAILESVDTAIIGVGSCGSVLYSNTQATVLLGQFSASGFLLLNHFPDGDCLEGEIAAMLREGSSSSMVRKVQYDRGQGARNYLIRASRMSTGATEAGRDGDRDYAACIVAVTDVTEFEQVVQRREEYDKRLGDVERILAYAAISGGIVHEMSQPLASIRNYIHALKGSFAAHKACGEYHTIADHLRVEVDRAIDVVRTVRRMGPANVDDSGICDVQEAIAHSMRLATLGASPPPPISLLGGQKSVFIAGSLPMVGQVIVNLLKNALSSSGAAGHAGAEIAVRCLGDHAEISVADNGKGVSEEAAREMFQPFSRSTRGGMGLGLAICQRIATSLGGSLSWENRQGGGAVFKFTVPLAKEGIVQ